MTKIDVTKPMELNDGTPVIFQDVLHDGEIRVTIERPHKISGTGRIFRADGSRSSIYTGSGFRLRNKAETFTVGQTVYFRDGRTGIYLGQLKPSIDDTVYAAKRGKREFITIAAYSNGRQYTGSFMESPDDFAAAPFAPAVTFTYRNVYADGTAGSTAHAKLETAKMATKVGKARIGILKIGTDGSTELLKCVPAVRMAGHSPATWTDA